MAGRERDLEGVMSGLDVPLASKCDVSCLSRAPQSFHMSTASGQGRFKWGKNKSNQSFQVKNLALEQIMEVE